jgi:hypothetical protein
VFKGILKEQDATAMVAQVWKIQPFRPVNDEGDYTRRMCLSTESLPASFQSDGHFVTMCSRSGTMGRYYEKRNYHQRRR